MTQASRVLLAAILVIVAPSCDRDTAAAPAAKARQQVSVETQRAPSTPPNASWRFPAVERLVAFGDLHGDLGAARDVLRLVGAIDRQDRWVGGNTVVVVTGDQTDRADDERKLIELLDDVSRQAKAAGGALHVLTGNHEVLNVAGHFDYVSEQGFAQFADVQRPDLRETLALLPPEARGRAAAFLPGGPYARRLAAWPVIIQVGDTVFVHGGILPEHVSYGIGRIDSEVSRWMKGELARLPEPLRSMRAPYWVRLYSTSTLRDEACPILSQTLATIGAKRMVVGHTPQKRINSVCGEQVWRIDVGLSKFYGPGALEALEIRGDQVRVLSAAVRASRQRDNTNATAE